MKIKGSMLFDSIISIVVDEELDHGLQYLCLKSTQSTYER